MSDYSERVYNILMKNAKLADNPSLRRKFKIPSVKIDKYDISNLFQENLPRKGGCYMCGGAEPEKDDWNEDWIMSLTSNEPASLKKTQSNFEDKYLTQMTIKELKQYAKQNNIKGYSKYPKKKQLLRYIMTFTDNTSKTNNDVMEEVANIVEDNNITDKKVIKQIVKEVKKKQLNDYKKGDTRNCGLQWYQKTLNDIKANGYTHKQAVDIMKKIKDEYKGYTGGNFWKDINKDYSYRGGRGHKKWWRGFAHGFKDGFTGTAETLLPLAPLLL